jgi:hypothetical protein
MHEHEAYAVNTTLLVNTRIALKSRQYIALLREPVANDDHGRLIGVSIPNSAVSLTSIPRYLGTEETMYDVHR